MGNKTKPKKSAKGLFAQAISGCVITSQPEGKSTAYGYRLACACGWQSDIRQGQINAVSGSTHGRFDCEACDRSVVLTVKEDRQASLNRT